MSKINILHNNEPTRCMVGTICLNSKGEKFPTFVADYRESQDQENADKLIKLLSVQEIVVLRIFGTVYKVFVDEDNAKPLKMNGQSCVPYWRVVFEPNWSDHEAFFKALMEQGGWVLCVVSQNNVLRAIIGQNCHVMAMSVVEATPETTEVFDHFGS